MEAVEAADFGPLAGMRTHIAVGGDEFGGNLDAERIAAPAVTQSFRNDAWAFFGLKRADRVNERRAWLQ